MAAAALGFVIVAVWYLGSYQGHGGSVAGMMNQMMGGGYGGGVYSPMPGSVWVILAALLVVVAVGAIGAGYYAAVPEIKTSVGRARSPVSEDKPEPALSWGVLVKTSKPDERRILEVLASHEGKYLQKFVVKEAGLSRLKTHRIVSRFAERGVISVEKKGNTNEITLAPWLRPAPPET